MNKRKFLKCLAVLLAMIALLPIAVSCKEEQEPDLRTKIVENGVSPYTVVYPKNSSTAVKTAVNDFVAAIAAATGVELPTKTDEVKRGVPYDSTTAEILFGRTGYDETAEALAAVKDGQFVIREVGRKLVYAAPKDADLTAMLDYFKASLLNQNVTEGEGGKTLAFQPYTSPEVEQVTETPVLLQEPTINGVKLSEYKIVYNESDAGVMGVLASFRTTLEEKYGVRLSLVIDRLAAEGEKEILVGKTNRTLSEASYAEKLPEMLSYEVRVQGTQVQLLYGGLFSARMCLEALADNIRDLGADGTYLKTDMAKKEVALHKDADLRIMTANVLTARWGELDSSELNEFTPPVSQRVEIFASMLAHYQPDVVGMQEACEVWGANLPPLLERLKKEYGIEYTWIHTEHNGKLNMTSILYRSDKLELLETEAVPYSYWSGDYYIRIMTWANLRVKAEPAKVFTVINTHWELSDRVEKVQICLREEIAKINSLRATYGYPLVAMGDFNSKQDTADYFRLLEEAHLTETRVEADRVGGLINRAGGCGKVGSKRSANSGNYIDHIYTTAGFSALRYETVIDNMTHWMTDHTPMIADIKFS